MSHKPTKPYPVNYCFWDLTDTVITDRYYPSEHRKTPKVEIHFSRLTETLPFRLLSNNKIDSLPDFYRIPVDSGGYRSIALKLIFRDGHIKQAEATPFYNAAITDVRYTK